MRPGSAWKRRWNFVRRACLPGMVEITTPVAEDATHDVGMHPIDDLIDMNRAPEDIIEQLSMALGAQTFQHGGALVYDDQTQSLLVRLPQSQHIALDWLLASLRRM